MFTRKLRPLMGAVVALLLGCSSDALVGPAPQPKPRVRSEETNLQIEIAWPAEHEAVTMSYVLIPGTRAPKTVEEVWEIANADREARLKLASGGKLQDPMRFPDVGDDPLTICAVAKRNREEAIGFACAAVDGPTAKLDPFAAG